MRNASCRVDGSVDGDPEAARVSRRPLRPKSLATFAGVALAGVALAVAGVGLLSAGPAAAATDSAFVGHTPAVFLAVGSPTQLQATTESVGQLAFHNVGLVSHVTYDAIAFDSMDNYIYGVETDAAGNPDPYHVVRVDADGGVTDTGTVVEASGGLNINIGVWDPDNNEIYFANDASRELFAYDPSTGAMEESSLNSSIDATDLAYAGGYFWGQVAGPDVVRVDPATDQVYEFAVSPDVFPAGMAATAAWSDGGARLGFSAGSSGDVYRVSLADMASAQPTLALVARQPGPRNVQDGSAGFAVVDKQGSALGGGFFALSATAPASSVVVDLTVAQLAAPQPYVAGSAFAYTVIVQNRGPADAVGARVSDPLPAALRNAGFTWTCVSGAGATCATAGSGGISDTVDIPAGGQVVYTVVGTVPTGTSGDLADTVTVTAPPNVTDSGCSPSCTSSTVDGPVAPSPSTDNVVGSGPTAIYVGETRNYSYTVVNTRNVTAPPVPYTRDVTQAGGTTPNSGVADAKGTSTPTTPSSLSPTAATATPPASAQPLTAISAGYGQAPSGGLTAFDQAVVAAALVVLGGAGALGLRRALGHWTARK